MVAYSRRSDSGAQRKEQRRSLRCAPLYERLEQARLVGVRCSGVLVLEHAIQVRKLVFSPLFENFIEGYIIIFK